MLCPNVLRRYGLSDCSLSKNGKSKNGKSKNGKSANDGDVITVVASRSLISRLESVYSQKLCEVLTGWDTATRMEWDRTERGRSKKDANNDVMKIKAFDGFRRGVKSREIMKQSNVPEKSQLPPKSVSQLPPKLITFEDYFNDYLSQV